MGSVTQKQLMSCGFACVAYLTNTPYDQIATRLDGPMMSLDYIRLDLAAATSGFRKTLPGRASYLVYKTD